MQLVSAFIDVATSAIDRRSDRGVEKCKRRYNSSIRVLSRLGTVYEVYKVLWFGPGHLNKEPVYIISRVFDLNEGMLAKGNNGSKGDWGF